MTRCLAVITARKGSKGIKNKNKRILNNKPVIDYTFEIAKKCKYIDDTILTTDDEFIKRRSKKFNIIAPFLRPKKLSNDKASQEDAMIHAIKWYEKNIKKKIDFICCLGADAPFRSLSSFNKAFKILKKNPQLDGVISVCKTEKSPNFMRQKLKNNLASNWVKKNEILLNRQEYPDYFEITSNVNIIKKDYFMKKKNLISKKSYILEIDPIEGLMLDSPIDFFLINSLAKNNLFSLKKINKKINK